MKFKILALVKNEISHDLFIFLAYFRKILFHKKVLKVGEKARKAWPSCR